MEKNIIKEAYEILYSHRGEMEQFMNYYVFKKMNIDQKTFWNKEIDFLKFVEFCLNTSQMPNNKNIKNGKEYFKKKYAEIKKGIENKNIDELKNIIYEATGVGQKIGSMMLEFIFLYSNKQDNEIAKELYVPLDSHVIRLLKESFHLNNLPEDHQLKIKDNNFINFQESLNQYTDGRPIVYFDYLWFVGKCFCNKTDENEKNRGYKLCNYCWLNNCCENNSKWEVKL